MANLTEETVVDKIEVVGEFKHIQVRTATIIKRDGVKISETFNRHVVSPGDDVTNETADVQAMSNILHTQQVKESYAAFKSAQTLPIESN